MPLAPKLPPGTTEPEDGTWTGELTQSEPDVPQPELQDQAGS